MKKYLFMAVAAIAALSSCSSDNDFEQSQTGKQALVFTATMENSEATRATFDNTKKCAAWEVGDQISINGKKYSAQTDGTTTTFEADNEGATGETYNAYFPADLYDGTTATLPAVQTYKDGKFNMPMYAESTTTELEFKNLCAVLAIKVSNTTGYREYVKSIKVASDKVMNGTFTVKDNKAVMGTDGTNAVVLKSYEAVTIRDKESRVFYIAIPAQEYEYLNIFLSADGKTYTQAMATKKVDGLGDIARSKIFNIDYKKNATKMWAGNLFIADCNIGATSLTGLGGLYCWGGIKDKDPESAYCPDDKLGDNDTATKLWGSNWRMPTKEELTKLSGLGTWRYSGKYGVNVLECKSTDYSDNTVTLPANGYWYGNEKEAGLYGHYWSSKSDPMQDGCAWSLRFGSEVNEMTTDGSCAYGYSVRAVLEEAETPAPATKGKATRNDGDSRRVEVEWVQLWEDGPKFAVYNVGAENNKPEDFGGYYCWGNSNDESKTWTGVFHDVKENLTGEHDTATNLWGNNWRMPTEEEYKALLENCSVVKEDLGGGKSGYRITGRNGVYTSNSIILPNAGDYDNGELIDPGCSFYWSSTQRTNYDIVGASYWTGNNCLVTNWYRNCGFSVRAVLNE